jgi:hypothetical protein
MIGLPSLHALDQAQAARIWLASEATDLRCAFPRVSRSARIWNGSTTSSGGQSFRVAGTSHRSKNRQPWPKIWPLSSAT